jgi:hypothetical protein
MTVNLQGHRHAVRPSLWVLLVVLIVGLLAYWVICFEYDH